MTVIDLWDPSTLDTDLLRTLEAGADVMRQYAREAATIDAEYDADPRMSVRRSNPWAEDHLALEAHVDALLATRIARAWHYARLTDDEVEAMTTQGIRLSGPESLRSRLAERVQRGDLTADETGEILRRSAMLGDQRSSREDQFCTTALPIRPTGGGTADLTGNWGGEAVYFHLPDGALKTRLTRIGRARVLELALPLRHLRRGSSAGRTVMAAYAHGRGIPFDRFMTDLFVVAPLPPDTVIAVHTEGDAVFDRMGTTYPPNRSGSYADGFAE